MAHFEIRSVDAFEFLAGLPKSSVDLVISSPPYFMGKEYDRSTKVGDFIEDHTKLLPLLLACLRPGGSICWQVGNHVRDGVVTPLDALVFAAFQSEELFLRNRIVWAFGHGTHAKTRFSGRHETILWYTKGRRYRFNLDAVRVPQKYPGKRHYKGPKKGQWSGNPLGKNPTDVWDIPNVKANHVEKTEHPCQFPVALAQRLIRALTKSGALVVDPFCGAGTVGIAAAIEGRRFLGSDNEESYIAIARARYAALVDGLLPIRPLDKEIYQPPSNSPLTNNPFKKSHKESLPWRPS